MTAAGELMLASARSWSRDYERLQEQLIDLRGLKRGTVRIAAIEASAEGYIPKTIQALRESHPGIAYLIEILDNNLVERAAERDLLQTAEAFGMESWAIRCSGRPVDRQVSPGRERPRAKRDQPIPA